MEASMLLAGVSAATKSPESPPGIKESVPPGEFQTVLKQAEGKSTGEVAENEPNAQPQNLDSNDKEIALELAIGFTNPALALIIAPSQPLNATPALPNSDLSSYLPENAIPNVSGEQVASHEALSELNITDFRAETVLPLAKDFRQSIVTSPTADAVSAPEVSTELTPTAAPVMEKLTAETKSVEPAKNLSSEPTADVNLELGAEPMGNESSNTDDSPDQSPPGQPGTPMPAIGTDTRVGLKVEESMGMSTAERTAVVHQLTQKIEQLAVNSVRNEVTVRMEPAELGTVLVQIARDANGISATLSASEERVHRTLSESQNELAAAITAKAHTPVRIEVISAESTSLASSSDANRHSGARQQGQLPTPSGATSTPDVEVAKPSPSRLKVKTTNLDLEI